jgi:uroporphyrinogen-III synthase
LNIFISRDLDKSSVFHTLKKNDVNLTGFSLVKIDHLTFDTIPQSDWIFFYSKNGIKHFFEGIKLEDKEDIFQRKFGLMGHSSADAFTATAGKAPDFISTSDLESSKQLFGELTKNQTVLFVKAKNSRASFEEMIAEEQRASLIVYDNVCRTDFEIPTSDILLFTSPLNAKSYYEKYKPLAHQKVISIGKTTTQFLEDECNITNVVTCKRFDEYSMVKCVKSLM